MCAASSLARNKAVAASSSGGGMRPAGVAAISFSRRPVFQSSRDRVDSVYANAFAPPVRPNTFAPGFNAFIVATAAIALGLAARSQRDRPAG
jgi:hypothetical protein